MNLNNLDNSSQCPHCHQEHSSEVKFCPNTGKNLLQDEHALTYSPTEPETTPSSMPQSPKADLASTQGKSKRALIIWVSIVIIAIGIIIPIGLGQRLEVITIVETVVITWTPDHVATKTEQAARIGKTATAISQATANVHASATSKAERTATALARATKTPTITRTPTNTTTRTPRPTSAPTADTSMLVRGPGEKSPGDHPVEVRNETNGNVTIYMYGDLFNYTFYIPAGFQTIYVRPGNYSFTFYSCGDPDPERGGGTFNSNWRWRFWCP